MQERKKLTMVKAQAYWKATKSKKSQMLDDFCESTGYCRRHAARVLHLAGQRYLLGNCILVADPAKHIQRHRPPRYGPLVLQTLITIWSASNSPGWQDPYPDVHGPSFGYSWCPGGGPGGT